MTSLNYKTILALALFVGVIGIFSVLWQQPWKASGSVAVSNGYQSTTTPNGVLDLTNLCPQGRNVASSTTGILGSIIMQGPNTGEVHVYDATTTIITSRYGSMATSSLLLGEIPAHVLGNGTTTTDTLTFDATFRFGLLIDMVGSAPTTTVTYRCNE